MVVTPDGGFRAFVVPRPKSTTHHDGRNSGPIAPGSWYRVAERKVDGTMPASSKAFTILPHFRERWRVTNARVVEYGPRATRELRAARMAAGASPCLLRSASGAVSSAVAESCSHIIGKNRRETELRVGLRAHACSKDLCDQQDRARLDHAYMSDARIPSSRRKGGRDRDLPKAGHGQEFNDRTIQFTRDGGRLGAHDVGLEWPCDIEPSSLKVGKSPQGPLHTYGERVSPKC